MSHRSGLALFTVGDEAYTSDDVMLAGHLWGAWGEIAETARIGLACLAALEDDDEAETLDEAAVEAAAADFRYARDLVAAEDMERWLDRHGLTVETWLDHLRRALARKALGERAAEVAEEYELDAAEITEAIVADAICSGRLGELAGDLAARAAVHARAVADAGADELTDVDVARVLDGVPDVEGCPVPLGRTPDAARARLAGLARLEAAWRRFADAETDPRAVQELVTTRWVDWIRITGQTVSVADRDIAAEIVQCVRLDGRTLAELAAEAGTGIEAIDWYLGEADEALRDALVAAKAGDLLGPLAVGARFIVVAVDARQPPAPGDPEVLARARRALLARAASVEVETRVTWCLLDRPATDP